MLKKFVMAKVFLLILLAILVNGDEILDHGYPEKNDGVIAKTRIQTVSYLKKVISVAKFMDQNPINFLYSGVA